MMLRSSSAIAAITMNIALPIGVLGQNSFARSPYNVLVPRCTDDFQLRTFRVAVFSGRDAVLLSCSAPISLDRTVGGE
jgi:hypothetical protein